MIILSILKDGFEDMWFQFKNYDMDAFWRDKIIRKSLMVWSVMWFVLDIITTFNVINYARTAVNWDNGMVLGIVGCIFALIFLFWLIGVTGLYLVYPLVKQED